MIEQCWRLYLYSLGTSGSFFFSVQKMKTQESGRTSFVMEAFLIDRDARRINKDNTKKKENELINANTVLQKKPKSILKTSIPSVFAVPRADKLSSYSGLFRCSVVIKGNKFLMYYDGAPRPVLRADKQQSMPFLPKYYIFDISQSSQGGHVIPLEKRSTQYVGKVRRDENPDIHAFELKLKRTSAHSRQSLYLLYEFAPSDWTDMFFRNIKPPRRARVALYNEESDIRKRGNVLTENIATSMKEMGSLDLVANPGMGLHVFPSKIPRKNEQGQFALNFFGRCQIQSEVNMQLQDDKDKIIVQLAKATDDTFNLDFRYVTSECVFESSSFANRMLTNACIAADIL